MDKLIEAINLYDATRGGDGDVAESKLNELLATFSDPETAVYQLMVMAYCKGEDRAHLMITGTP